MASLSSCKLISGGVVSIRMCREFLKSGNVVAAITKAKTYVERESIYHMSSITKMHEAERITKPLEA
jgi:hypothetical protein